MTNDEQFYAAVADEIARGQIDRALWTKAFALSGGEDNATKSHYCRLRAEQLQKGEKRQTRSVRLAHTKKHALQLGIGLFLLAIGIGLSAASYSAAEPGGRYVVASGLILGGFIASCRGLWGLLRSLFLCSTDRTPPPLPTAPERTGEISPGTAVLIISVSGIVIVGIALSCSREPNPSATPQAAVQPVLTPAATPVEDRRAALGKKILELQEENRSLSILRNNLDPGDPEQVTAFNRQVADYSRRLQIARDEKTRSGQ